MNVEQDELGIVLERELDAEPALHRRDQVNVGSVVEDVLDELDVRHVVLDVEERVQRPNVGSGEWRMDGSWLVRW